MPDNAILETLAGALSNQTQLLKEMRQGLVTKAPAAYGTHQQLHGNNSLWGTRAYERDVITAHLHPYGLGSRLPWFPSVVESPIFPVITGYDGETGDEATNPCDPNPTGYMLAGSLTAQFGRIARDTNTIEIDKVMLRANRGDFTDLMLRGRLFDQNSRFIPGSLSPDQIVNIVTKSEMVTVGVNLDRKLARLTWQGNPANKTAGGGYKEFPGLDRQVATGQVDALDNTALPALDSDVKDFAFDRVDGSGRDIVEYLSMIEFYLRTNAEGMGLDPVTWVVVMRPELWQELTAVWPCRYNTNKCATNVIGSNSQVIVDGRENVTDRDRMRQERRIEINGMSYEVILDNGIFEYNSTNADLEPGVFASSIYFLPVTITGGFPVLYWEYIDYRQAAPDIALLNGQNQFWTDDGRFLWAYEGKKFCFTLTAKIEPRIVLRTPQLAGRIDRVAYSPLQHIRQPFPDDPYFSQGGVSIRGSDNLFAVWK